MARHQRPTPPPPVDQPVLYTEDLVDETDVEMALAARPGISDDELLRELGELAYERRRRIPTPGPRRRPEPVVLEPGAVSDVRPANIQPSPEIETARLAMFVHEVALADREAFLEHVREMREA